MTLLRRLQDDDGAESTGSHPFAYARVRDGCRQTDSRSLRQVFFFIEEPFGLWLITLRCVSFLYAQHRSENIWRRAAEAADKLASL